MIEKCNAIIEDYQALGLRLTLRQLYYQLVSRNVIPNREREYKNLGALLSNARLAGKVDWGAIEDRVRHPRRHSEFRNLSDLVDAACDAYRLPRWDTQPAYAELWVEKDALAGVLEPITDRFHAVLMVNRGYSSQTAMFDSANRFRARASGRPATLFYVGDHDPSGEDMVRDIRDRFEMFGVDVGVVKLALTMAQVRTYNPPPNPAKMTDPRANGYVREHGAESWEVDALPPDVLADIIVTAFEAVVDQDAMDDIIARETRDRRKLRTVVKRGAKRRRRDG